MELHTSSDREPVEVLAYEVRCVRVLSEVSVSFAVLPESSLEKWLQIRVVVRFLMFPGVCLFLSREI